MLAPAQVPPTTAPRARAPPRSPPRTAVPLTIAGQLELVAAGHEDAGDVVEQADDAGSSASSRVSGRRRRPRRRRACGTGRRTPRRSRGRARRRSGPPRCGRPRRRPASTNCARTVRLPSLSSAPPMAISGPRSGGGALGRLLAAGSAGPIGMQRSLRGARLTPVTDLRRLVVMRHAKAEPFARDGPRAPADRPRPARRRRGRRVRLRDAGAACPTTRSSPRRCAPGRPGRPSPRAPRLATSRPDLDDALYAAGAETALDVAPRRRPRTPRP